MSGSEKLAAGRQACGLERHRCEDLPKRVEPGKLGVWVVEVCYLLPYLENDSFVNFAGLFSNESWRRKRRVLCLDNARTVSSV